MLNINLSSRLALVTGGAGELGPAIVRTLGQCGADVAVHYHRNKERAVALCAELAANGRRAMAVEADITNLESVMKMRDEVRATFGSPDIIVNNAVVQYKPWATVLEQPAEDYEGQFRSCVLQNVFMAKAFVPAMIEKRWGRVIGINTVTAIQCGREASAYASAKRGMDGVLRVLAREIGSHQVTVNQIAPGLVITDKFRASGQDAAMRNNPKIPLGRHGEDQEIANVAAFLASDLAGYITGAFIPVCGGKEMTAI